MVVAPSVPDGGSKLLSQSESSTPERFCTRVSKMRQASVQNGGLQRTERTKRTGEKSRTPISPIGPIGPMKTLCRQGVQNEDKCCPKWGKPASREWKARKGAKWKVKSGETRKYPQTSQTSQYSQTICAGLVSPANAGRWTGVQNGFVVVVPSVSDGASPTSAG